MVFGGAGGDIDRSGEALLDALDEYRGAVYAFFGEDDQELVATEAYDEIGPAYLFLEDLGDLAQDPVAEKMPLGVVDVLEIIDVDEHHGEAFAAASGCPDVAHQHLHVSAIREARQRVDERKPVRFLNQVNAEKGAVGELREVAHEGEILGLDDPGLATFRENEHSFVADRHVNQGHGGGLVEQRSQVGEGHPQIGPRLERGDDSRGSEARVHLCADPRVEGIHQAAASPPARKILPVSQ